MSDTTEYDIKTRVIGLVIGPIISDLTKEQQEGVRQVFIDHLIAFGRFLAKIEPSLPQLSTLYVLQELGKLIGNERAKVLLNEYDGSTVYELHLTYFKVCNGEL